MQARWALLLAVAAVFVSAETSPSSSAGEVVIDIEKAGEVAARRAELLVDCIREDSSSQYRQALPAVDLATPLNVRLRVGDACTLTLQAPGVWGASGRVVVSLAPARITLPLLPGGTLEGRISVPVSERVPQQMTVQVLPSVKDAFPAWVREAVIACPVRGGTWRCQLPAGRLDVRLRAEGFVSEYLWGVSLAAGRSWSVGTLALRRGASVSGWVRAADGRVPEGCSLSLSLPMEASDSTEKERQRFTAVSRAVGGEGFFHIADVSPGRYLLSVRHPNYAPLAVFPVPVEEGVESALSEPLVLEPPLELRVALIPESDPSGERWEVNLSRS